MSVVTLTTEEIEEKSPDNDVNGPRERLEERVGNRTTYTQEPSHFTPSPRSVRVLHPEGVTHPLRLRVHGSHTRSPPPSTLLSNEFQTHIYRGTEVPKERGTSLNVSLSRPSRKISSHGSRLWDQWTKVPVTIEFIRQSMSFPLVQMKHFGR